MNPVVRSIEGVVHDVNVCNVTARAGRSCLRVCAPVPSKLLEWVLWAFRHLGLACLVYAIYRAPGRPLG